MSPAAGKLERKVLEHVLPLSNLRSSHSCSCFMFRSASGHQIPLPFLQLRVPKPRGMHHLPRALADSGSAPQGPGDGGAAAAVPRAALSEPKHGQVSLGLGTVLETFFFLKEKQYCFPQEVKSRRPWCVYGIKGKSVVFAAATERQPQCLHHSRLRGFGQVI